MFAKGEPNQTKHVSPVRKARMLTRFVSVTGKLGFWSVDYSRHKLATLLILDTDNKLSVVML
ncbi:hypothetical protein P5673_004306 [Acropora cervicornis]|uniref:Uncharacterized protein n=1 Tax=Acropora cervicornis TaxID=6130 RepID=A0AAD9R006_ACRCE|nr:hypothetical protein P5673_004306 [Acropora cervicornis]